MNYLHDSKNYQAGQGEIKKFLNLNASTVSGIIDRLEVKGLVARLPKSGDKRVVTIALTTNGDKLLERLPWLLQEKLAEKIERLDMQKRRQMKESLELLVDLLDIEDLEAFSPVTSGAQE